MNKIAITHYNGWRRAIKLAPIAGALLVGFSSCTTAPSGPNPPNPTPPNSISVDEFYSPPPTGSADDYYMLLPGDDDMQFSYFLDEQDYVHARNEDENTHDGFHFAHDEIKRGHGYGDHNHMHIHWKGGDDDHGVLVGEKFGDWTDSLNLTDSERRSIDTAMQQFHLCADSAIATFRIVLQPYRDSFKVQRLAIIAKLDSAVITRDSARKLLDSAIARYDTLTVTIRAAFVLEIKGCLTELDAFLKTRITPVQYAIWVRNRGW